MTVRNPSRPSSFYDRLSLLQVHTSATTLKCNIPPTPPIHHVHEGIIEGSKREMRGLPILCWQDLGQIVRRGPKQRDAMSSLKENLKSRSSRIMSCYT